MTLKVDSLDKAFKVSVTVGPTLHGLTLRDSISNHTKTIDIRSARRYL